MAVRKRRTAPQRRAARPTAVDVHAHLAPQGYLAEARKGTPGGPAIERNAEGHEFIVFDEKAPAGYRRMRLMRGEYDHDARLAEMDAGGIRMQIVSLTPPFFHYWAEPARGKDFCRMANEEIAGTNRYGAFHPPGWEGYARYVGVEGKINVHDLYTNALIDMANDFDEARIRQAVLNFDARQLGGPGR